MIAGFQFNTLSLLHFIAENSSLSSIRRFWPEVKTFSSSKSLRCYSMSVDIFCFWDESKLNLLESVYLVLNISDYCSNDRFIRIRALTFLDDSFRVSHNFYFVDSQSNP
ncbi:hypothetical protein ES319_D07G027000v1 [Gossypium barbadense]|uniref:Uncharacterized protein n=1 Tax=Gossypium barbadense TaxID=3634 RepID=A0A5J5QLE3_GOSBA|nr:hypothetical protein ES319_D07G027000v1 [Gossypium barbadense]